MFTCTVIGKVCDQSYQRTTCIILLSKAVIFPNRKEQLFKGEAFDLSRSQTYKRPLSCKSNLFLQSRKKLLLTNLRIWDTEGGLLACVICNFDGTSFREKLTCFFSICCYFFKVKDFV